MTVVERHPTVDPQTARSQVDGLLRRTPEALDRARGDARSLAPLVSRLTMLVGFASAAEPPPADDDLRSWVRTAAEAGAALFDCAVAAPGTPVQSDVDGPAGLTGLGPDGAANLATWVQSFCLAAVARRPDLLDRLCAVPPATLAAAGPGSDAYLGHWAEALRRTWTAGADPLAGDVYDALDAAMDATGTTTVAPPDLVRQVVRPTLTLLGRLAAVGYDAPPDPERVTAFDAALAEALEGHRAYWGDGPDAQKSTGLVAWEPLAIACLARDRGVPVGVSSPYLPPALLDQPPAARSASPSRSDRDLAVAVAEDGVRARYDVQERVLDAGAGTLAGAWRVRDDSGERYVVAEALPPDAPLGSREVDGLQVEQGTRPYLEAALADAGATDLAAALAEGRVDYVLIRPVVEPDGSVSGTERRTFEL